MCERGHYNKYSGAICINKTVMENPRHMITLSEADYPGELSGIGRSQLYTSGLKLDPGICSLGSLGDSWFRTIERHHTESANHILFCVAFIGYQVLRREFHVITVYYLNGSCHLGLHNWSQDFLKVT